MIQKLAILGSTGSIGRQTLDVVRAHSDRFQVYALVANNSADLLIEQASLFNPEVVVIANENLYPKVREALNSKMIKVFAGSEAIVDVVKMPDVDVVVTAMVGYAGLAPTIEAIKAGKKIALANKETLVVAGELITNLAARHNVPIVPIDSEHGAVLQCLVGEDVSSVEQLIITASGGPFRSYSLEALAQVTAAQALRHPTWQMGAKITIDSASMMNKGFEVMEARWLFGIEADRINVVVHPQSIVHSMVQFTDGSIKAQLGATDMRIPILYALTFPERINTDIERINLAKIAKLTFEEPDAKRFRNLGIAYEALRRGGNCPCIVNAANEVVVEAFLHDRIGFLQMSDVIERTIEALPFIERPDYSDLVATDHEARIFAAETFR